MPLIGQNQQNYLTLARSRNVNGHVSIPLDRAFPTGGPWDRTKPISPAFLKDMGPKHNGITTLIFLGYVTLSVT